MFVVAECDFVNFDSSMNMSRDSPQPVTLWNEDAPARSAQSSSAVISEILTDKLLKMSNEYQNKPFQGISDTITS